MQVKSNDAKATVMRKINDLLDAGSFMEVGEHVSARFTDFYQPDSVLESDGVVIGYGTIDGNLVFVYAQNSEVMGGTFGEMHGRKIVKLYSRAMKAGAPVIGLLDCAGFRIEEGLDGLNQFAKLYAVQTEASGKIPQIAAVIGQCGGGMSLSAEQNDFLFVEKDNGSLFVNPKGVVTNDIGDNASISATNDGEFEWKEIAAKIKKLVAAIPANSNVMADVSELSDAELNRECAGLASKAGDAKAILTDISDNGELLETAPEFGRDMVTGFIKIAGQTVGVAACNAVDGEKRLTADGLDKAADLVDFCDRFGLPILTITDTDGFDTKSSNEKYLPAAAGRLLKALTAADGLKINLVTGNVTGSAYSLLNSRGLGADYTFMWDSAVASIVNPRQAVEVLFGKWSQENEDKFKEVQSGALALARHGLVDKVIDPEETRKYLIGAFQTFVNSSR